VTLQLKRGTSVDWATRNPILAPGEPGFESDTGQLKIGSGSTGWNSLTYINSSPYNWVEDIPSKYDIFITRGGSVQVGVDISNLPKSTRYFLTLSPINTVTYTTSKSKSLSVIINYTTGGDIIGGSTLFLDINNYITLSSHPSIPGMILVNFVSNSSVAESFSVSVRKIF